MKFSFAIFILLGSMAAQAANLTFTNIDGWAPEKIKSGSLEHQLFSGAEWILSVTDTNSVEKPAVKLFSLGPVKNFRQTSAVQWKKILLEGKKPLPRITSEQVLKSGRNYRYIVEFQTDQGIVSPDGKPDLFYSAVMGFVLDGQLKVLVYEQHQEIYGKNIANIKQLFKKVEIATAK